MPSKVGGYTLAIGVGGYKSQQAYGISAAFRAGDGLGGAILSVGVGHAGGGDPVYKAGAAWEF